MLLAFLIIAIDLVMINGPQRPTNIEKISNCLFNFHIIRLPTIVDGIQSFARKSEAGLDSVCQTIIKQLLRQQMT